MTIIQFLNNVNKKQIKIRYEGVEVFNSIFDMTITLNPNILSQKHYLIF